MRVCTCIESVATQFNNCLLRTFQIKFFVARTRDGSHLKHTPWITKVRALASGEDPEGGRNFSPPLIQVSWEFLPLVPPSRKRKKWAWDLSGPNSPESLPEKVALGPNRGSALGPVSVSFPHVLLTQGGLTFSCTSSIM